MDRHRPVGISRRSWPSASRVPWSTVRAMTGTFRYRPPLPTGNPFLDQPWHGPDHCRDVAHKIIAGIVTAPLTSRFPPLCHVLPSLHSARVILVTVQARIGEDRDGGQRHDDE